MSFSGLSKDRVTLVKTNGKVFEDIQANVQRNMIFIHDPNLPIEENDKIYRKLPSGLIETYVVVDRGFYSALGGHYQLKVRREGEINESKFQSIVNVYSVSGPNSRVNINSVDNSKNYNIDTDSLFNDLKVALENLPDKELQNRSVQLIEELKSSQKTPLFITKYQEFIALLANHMTVIAPFIPALTQLI